MKRLINRLSDYISNLANSIAFYPTVITLGFAILAVIVMILERQGLGEILNDYAPILLINNEATARSILSIIAGGMLSLMVFSFSMVMLMLNQASSNFSPRVLPGLISNKKHQFVLGVFLGTIVFSLVVFINLAPVRNDEEFLGFSSFIALQLGIFSLAVFIYFLDSISREVQIGHILQNLYAQTYRQLHREFNQENSRRISKEKDTSDWHLIYSDNTGYLQSVSESGLLALASKYECSLSIMQPKGAFVITGMPLIQSEKKLESEQEQGVLSKFHFDTRELISQNFTYGFKQITEIVVKAMSPGINDPGTAQMGIDFLSDLFRLRQRLPDYELLKSEKQAALVYLADQSFEELLYTSLSSIRQYVKHDVMVGEKLIKMLGVLLKGTHPDSSRRQVIMKEMRTLKMDLKNNIDNPVDLEMLLARFREIEREQGVTISDSA